MGMKNTALERAIAVLDGPTETSHVLRVSYWTIREWRKAGRVRDSRMAVLLAEAAQAAGAKDVTVRALSGLEDEPNGKGGKRPRNQLTVTSSESSPPEPTDPLADAPTALAA